MREVGAHATAALGIVDDLPMGAVVAVVYGPNADGVTSLHVNRLVAFGGKSLMVVSWARRELARGARISWLLADELADLA